MICPHCRKNLKRKERPGQQCTHCKKGFALEPKENPLTLHDIRMMRLSELLSNNGTYRFTSHQLYYAAARKALRKAGRFPVGQFLVSLIGVPILYLIGTAGDVPFFLIPAVLVTVGWVIYIAVRIARRKHRRVQPPMTHAQFVTAALNPWKKTYRGDVPGLVREERVHLGEDPPHPALVVLCPDHPTLIGLWVNGVTARCNVALVQRIRRVPAGVPVALLHDVSVEGYRFAAEARATLGRRVVTDLTPRPGAVKGAKGAVRLREARPPAEVVGWLGETGLLTGPDVDWLASGWWSPVAALRPSTVIGRVATAAQRAGDPDRRAAATVGFLTWPGGRAG
jgi:hypothetical protein